MQAIVPFLVLILLTGPLTVVGAQEPQDCGGDGDRWHCEYVFEVQPPEFRNFDMSVRVYTRALVTITVVLEGTDGGWRYMLVDGAGAAVSTSFHYPERTRAGETYHAQTDTHLMPEGNAGTYTLKFGTGAVENDPFGTDVARSTGTFRVLYTAERLPEGIAPERPAATREVPHLRDDAELDTPDAATDLVAAWLDDARLADGVMDVHLAVRGLDALDHQTTGNRSRVYSWYLGFTVLERPYLVRWFSAEDEGAPEWGCELREGGFGDGATRDIAESALIMTPRCEWDVATGTLHAAFPERAIGNPSPGLRFQTVFARSYTWDTAFRMPSSAPAPHDEMAAEQFPFALGGPSVWSAYSPQLDPPGVAPWYRAPFHEENLPDTLQVVGALTATATFLGGLVLLAGRRRKLRGLLEEVDHVAERHEHDARAALLALGELDARFTRAFRAGRLTEAQYQVVTQRVASAATRFALRRELGLDDGTPGDGPARTLTVKENAKVMADPPAGGEP